MGIFYDMAEVINLAPIPLRVTFDGQSIDIPPGKSMLPKVVVAYAKNQNPIRGTQSPNNPTISGAQYLINIAGGKGRQEPLSQEEWEEHLGQPSRINVEELADEKLGPGEKFMVRGRGPTQAKSTWDAGVRVTTNQEFGDAE